MARKENQKIKLLVLMDILKNYSDEEHPLGIKEIIAKLQEFGIEAGRKAIYDDIELLNQYGYEVLCNKGRSNKYYVVDRNFDIAELKILVDAVYSSRFITVKKSKELTQKIADLAGVHKAKLLTKNIQYEESIKVSNEHIYYTTDNIDTAINSNKKIGFYYFDLDCHGDRIYRKNKEQYVVNPVALVYNENKYYLVCYDDKHMNMINYRVDKMDDVKILNESRTPNQELKEFKVGKHTGNAFQMFTGKTEKVAFSVSDKLLDVIFDKFGEKTKFINYGEGRYKFYADIQISPTFYGWCATFGKDLTILSPENVRSGYIEHIRSSLDGYNN